VFGNSSGALLALAAAAAGVPITKLVLFEPPVLLDAARAASFEPLARDLARLVTEGRGIAADPSAVMITRGSQMALDLVARALIRPGDVVAVEALGYPNAVNVFRRAGAKVVPIPLDQHGLDVDALAAVNAAVNGAIVPAAKPATAAWEIDPRSGNCGDYAVSKRHALLKAGWPSARLLLAEVILRNNGEHHLVLIARGQQSGHQIWVLDNLHGQLMTLSETRQHYTLMRVQSPDDPKLWQSSLDDRARTASLSAVDSSR